MCHGDGGGWNSGGGDGGHVLTCPCVLFLAKGAQDTS